MRKAGLIIGLWSLTMLAASCSKPASSRGAAGGEATASLAAPTPGPVVRIAADDVSPGPSFLSWDTEGGKKVETNLLRTGRSVRVQYRASDRTIGGPGGAPAPAADPAWQDARVIGRRRDGGGSIVFLTLEAGPARLEWRIATVNALDGIVTERPDQVPLERIGSLSLTVHDLGAAPTAPGSLRLVFPFDPKITSTTVIPAGWLADGTFRLPAVVNAPDWGPMVLSEEKGRPVVGRLEGSRAAKTVDLLLELPAISSTEPVTLTLAPLLLPPPAGLPDASLPLWLAARRGWLNALQPCARWGEQDKPFSAPAGVLGNNVISDPASVSIWFYADQAFFYPRIAPGVSVMPLVRRTLDYWLDQRMRRDAAGRLTGEITGYWDYGDFLDAEASPLIAAWDYVESTGDLDWLVRRLERLEMAADFLAARDVDKDGFVEATQPGTPNSLQQPHRSDAWWDALNCGHKDGYTNALIYRAWRSIADLEAKLGRTPEATYYTRLADRLKAVYARTLYNPQTGLLAWWRDRDGALHDYVSPTLNGLAIEYGLLEPNQARAILDRLRIRMAEAGFTRFELGVPPMLLPVRRSDYLQPNCLGLPSREDGTDTFGYYMNGGITAGHVLHYLMAHYVLDDPKLAGRADEVLRAMLGRQRRGEFQNGVRDATFEGLDWTTWDGKPAGYEGYLADSFRFLQAVMMREPALRAKLYRPLAGAGPAPKINEGRSPAATVPEAPPDAGLKEDIAFLESSAADLLRRCVMKASDGTPLYTPDGKPHYAALWTRDFASMVEYAGDLMPAADIERCIDYLVRGMRDDGAVPDRVQVDGLAVYAAGSPENPLGQPNLDNPPFLVLAAAACLDLAPAERRPALYRKWAPALAKGLSWVPLAPSGLVWNDPAKPHSPYGFTDTVGKTGELFMESVLYWRAARILAGWAKTTGDAGGAEAWTNRARAVEGGVASLWDEATGMFFAASLDCRQTDIWGCAYALYYDFPLGGRGDRVLSWLAANVDRYVWHGQIRHLPAGEYWQRQLMPVEKERYQNGAYWATASGWVMAALERRVPALARRLFRDLIADFRAGGICECVNSDGTRQLPTYVNSATNPLGAARRLWAK
jgi:Mannosylglycerate hydrolase MGH1-like glycoside hydrolase domain